MWYWGEMTKRKPSDTLYNSVKKDKRDTEEADEKSEGSDSEMTDNDDIRQFIANQMQNLPTREDFEVSVEVLNRIPTKYRTLEESDLSVEVAEGDNEFNVVLE